MPISCRRSRLHILVLLGYGVLALALTWPLALHMLTHVPGNGVDDPPLTWNLWWVQHALLTLGANPYSSQYLFYPLGINLAFYTLTVLNGLLSIPVQAVTNLVLTSNLLLLSSFVLGAYGTFLLALQVLALNRRRGPFMDEPTAVVTLLAAFLAGLFYAFASSKLAYAALGQWNIASSQWIPFYVLYLLKIGASPHNWRYPFLAALFLLLQAYAELTYASFLVLFTLLWFVGQVVARLHKHQAWELGRLVVSLATMVLLTVAGLMPILGRMIPEMIAEGDFLAEGTGFADVFSADLIGFLVPTMYHPVLGWLVGRFSFDHSVGQHIYLGYTVMALSLVAIISWQRRHNKRLTPDETRGSELAGHADSTMAEPSTAHSIHSTWFWSLSALFFFLLSLGPTLRINGHDTGIPLPFSLVAQLPFFKGNRYPSRYGVLLVLCVAILLAFGTTRLVSKAAHMPRLRARPAGMGLVACLLASVLLFEHLSAPLPLSDMRVPPVYQIVTDQMPPASTLLDLPVAWRNGFRVTGTQHPIIMFEQYYQTAHSRPILAGNTSRNPPLKFQYFTEAPVINTIIALETGHAPEVDPAVVDQDRSLAADVLRFFNISAIVVHPAHTGPELVSYVESITLVERIYEDAETIGYRVNLPPWPDTWAAAPDDPLGRLSYAEGWGVPANGAIWAQRQAVRLLVPLDGNAQQMSFWAYAPEANQQVVVELDGHPVQKIPLLTGWMEYQLRLPGEQVDPGLNEIWLHFDRLQPTGTIHMSPRAIGTTGVESPVNLVVQSAGQEVGDLGYIYVNGLNMSPNERGYNVVVLNPQTGSIEAAQAFDTHLDEGASSALAAFLEEVPSGHIVAVAAADEASRLLGPDAVNALNKIGAAGDLRGKFRWGHALIGVQGAAPGTAAETLGWMRPVTVVAGEGATEPHLAVALSALQFHSVTNP